jgi:ubiquinone/menaquinone biosynthesis C-methylase UbiE
MWTTNSEDRLIKKNIGVHDKIASRYERIHGEIFNAPEQNRLNNCLREAVSFVVTSSSKLKALDFGCGSGNLSYHLLQLGLDVTAADVSVGCLDLVRGKYKDVDCFQLNGKDLNGLSDNYFDFIAMYSVLHHIPDYLAAIKEISRVCKPGGVIYIDHENNDEFWEHRPVYLEFRNRAKLINWNKYLHPSNYLHKLKRFINPHYTNEGDIHVWDDDHIEWKVVEDLMESLDFEVVLVKDYLLFNRLYKPDVYEEYKDKCTDTRIMGFRKKAN